MISVGVTDDEVVDKVEIGAPGIDEIDLHSEVVVIEIVHGLAHRRVMLPKYHLDLPNQAYFWEKDILHLVVGLVILVRVDVLV